MHDILNLSSHDIETNMDLTHSISIERHKITTMVPIWKHRDKCTKDSSIYFQWQICSIQESNSFGFTNLLFYPQVLSWDLA